MPAEPPALRLARVSRRQYGAFTRCQAIACGFSESTIHRRLQSGLLIPAHPGVYLDPSAPETLEQQAMAACLACGSGSVSSHLTAAVLLGLDLALAGRPEVTVPPGLHPRSAQIRVHRTRSLAPYEVATIKRVPITSAMRVLADLAGPTDPLLLEIMVDTFWRRRSIDPMRTFRYMSRPSQLCRPGTGTLRALLRERIGLRPPGSDLETIYLQILKEFGVPLPERQHPVTTRHGPRFIDLAYPDHRVAIELNGFDRHARDRIVFDDDHLRRNDIEALGWSIREFTWTHCVHNRAYVAMTTAEAIGLVPVRWAPRTS